MIIYKFWTRTTAVGALGGVRKLQTFDICSELITCGAARRGGNWVVCDVYRWFMFLANNTVCSIIGKQSPDTSTGT